MIKTRKRCCKSRPRCKKCPVVCKRLEQQGLAERGDRHTFVLSSNCARSSTRPRALTRLDILPPVMSTCLVTGGAGFLGSHLCDELLSRGHRVICVDNFETGSLANIAAPPRAASSTSSIRTSRSRSSSTSRWTSSTTSPRPASPIDYLRLPLHTLKVGSYGTHHALGLAKHHRARFLTASTSEVYGDPQVHPQPETYWGHVNPIGPRGVYDEAKRYAEALTMAYHRQQGVDTAIVRIFNTYGPRMRPHDGRAIPTFMRQALQDRPITVFGDGSQTRSFSYVDDLIDGIIRLAGSGLHHPVNIGNPNEFTLLELAARGDRDHRLALGDRVRGAAHGRSPGPPARHLPRPRVARLGADRRAARRASPHAGEIRRRRPHRRRLAVTGRRPLRAVASQTAIMSARKTAIQRPTGCVEEH